MLKFTDKIQLTLTTEQHEGWRTDSQCSWKSMCNFWLARNLTTVDQKPYQSKQLMHSLYVICSMYCILKASWREENFFTLLQISKKFSSMFIEKNPHINGFMQSKPMFVQGSNIFQICSFFMYLRRCFKLFNTFFFHDSKAKITF